MKAKKRKKRSPSTRRYSGRNVHHLTPRSRRKDKGIRKYKGNRNKMLIKIERHEAINRLFPGDTLEEMILKLIRLYETRRARLNNNNIHISDKKIKDWITLFGNRSLGRIIILLLRLHRAKKRRFD